MRITGSGSLIKWLQPHQFHCQLANLGVEIMDLVIVINSCSISDTRKNLAKTIHRLTLLRTHLVWMELVLGKNSLGRLVAPKDAKSHAGLKIRDKITSFSHLVFLLQRMEYTFSPCPVFRDHLIILAIDPPQGLSSDNNR